MRAFAWLLSLAALAGGPVGCGESKKQGDNSDIQTPNDQPLGMPKGVGGAPAGNKAGGVQFGTGQGKPGKPLPPIELKQ